MESGASREIYAFAEYALTMWILVIGPPEIVQGPEAAAACLGELGCRVETADFWSGLERPGLRFDPPSAVLIEAVDEIEAGRAALERVRAVPSLREVPVLLAASVAGVHRIDARDGFDDFVLVPYVPAELYTRIRRAEWRRSDFRKGERIKLGPLSVDLAAHEVQVDGRTASLTHQEFALLKFLIQHRGRVFTRDELLERVWGVRHYGASRTVDIHVRRLRMKLGPALRMLQTVRGVGYKISGPHEAEQPSSSGR